MSAPAHSPFPTRSELVAAWLRDHDRQFWARWETMAHRHPADPRRRLNAAFALLAKHVSDPGARGCAMTQAAVELTDEDHPARRIIEAHKAKLRARLAELCSASGAREPGFLADQLFLLMKGAQATPVLGVQGAARNVERDAASLIDSQLGGNA